MQSKKALQTLQHIWVVFLRKTSLLDTDIDTDTVALGKSYYF
ncbi:MAG: hypothetical protein O4751_01725 [Trichodesmium sp. St2_bin6]|nr:hypothetical protein [Trichodesmium sp. St2_bin6]